jgi:hypothetical protein
MKSKKSKIYRILFSLLLLPLFLTVGCEDDSEGTGVDADGNVDSNIILLDGDGNAIRQNTTEEEMLHEEEEGGEE